MRPPLLARQQQQSQHHQQQRQQIPGGCRRTLDVHCLLCITHLLCGPLLSVPPQCTPLGRWGCHIQTPCLPAWQNCWCSSTGPTCCRALQVASKQQHAGVPRGSLRPASARVAVSVNGEPAVGSAPAAGGVHGLQSCHSFVGQHTWPHICLVLAAQTSLWASITVLQPFTRDTSHSAVTHVAHF